MSQTIIYIISILKNEMKWCGCKSGLNMNVKFLRKPSSVGVESCPDRLQMWRQVAALLSSRHQHNQ